jgi:hypothetical protein
MILKSVRPVPVMAALLLSGLKTGASARDDGQYNGVDPATREWVQGLKDKTGEGCCETADGHPTNINGTSSGVGTRCELKANGTTFQTRPSSVGRTSSVTLRSGIGGPGKSMAQ